MNVQTATNIVSSVFNFSVDKFPLSGPENMRTPFYGLFRSDNQQVVGSGSVSSRYLPHTTDDILALTESALESIGGDCEVSCHFDDGHYVKIKPSVEYRREVFDNDTVWPQFLIRAGYDGEAFSASLGLYRDMCRNMHIMRQVQGTTVRIRHTNSLRSKMDDLINTFELLKGSWERLLDTVKAMNTGTVLMVDFLDAIYGKPEKDEGRGATIHRNRTEAIFRRLQKEHTQLGLTIPSDFKVSAWLAFNAVQGYVQHDSTRKGEVNDWGRLISAQDSLAVRKAEELALAAAI